MREEPKNDEGGAGASYGVIRSLTRVREEPTRTREEPNKGEGGA